MAEVSAHSLGSDDVSVSETCESFDFVSRPWADHVPVLNDEVISDKPVANPDVSYAEATRPAQPVKDVKNSVSTDNDVPDRPCTAFVTASLLGLLARSANKCFSLLVSAIFSVFLFHFVCEIVFSIWIYVKMSRL